jgi:hypothetical protein
MSAELGIAAHDYQPSRPPEAGAQVRILPGAPIAGGPRNSGVFAKAPLCIRLICLISGADFIARFIARWIVARILLMCKVARGAPAVMEDRRLRQTQPPSRAGMVPCYRPGACYLTLWNRRSRVSCPLHAIRGDIRSRSQPFGALPLQPVEWAADAMSKGLSEPASAIAARGRSSPVGCEPRPGREDALPRAAEGSRRGRAPRQARLGVSGPVTPFLG